MAVMPEALTIAELLAWRIAEAEAAFQAAVPGMLAEVGGRYLPGPFLRNVYESGMTVEEYSEYTWDWMLHGSGLGGITKEPWKTWAENFQPTFIYQTLWAEYQKEMFDLTKTIFTIFVGIGALAPGREVDGEGFGTFANGEKAMSMTETISSTDAEAVTDDDRNWLQRFGEDWLEPGLDIYESASGLWEAESGEAAAPSVAGLPLTLPVLLLAGALIYLLVIR